MPQVRLWVPQSQQSWESTLPGLQSPCPWQVPQEAQEQDEVHDRDRVPQFPHASSSVAPGAQTPCPVQVLALPHWQLDVQVRLRVPQFPQASC